jgi:hypothetical protein
MDPCPSSPPNPPGSTHMCIPSADVPARKPPTPLHVSVGVSPIHVQHTPPRTLVSRGLSPVPFENLLPPDIAAFFNSTQMQLTQSTQASPARPPVRLPDSDVISVTSSESASDHERPLARSSRPCPRAIVPETQVLDPLVSTGYFYVIIAHKFSRRLQRYGRRRMQSVRGLVDNGK